MRKAGNILKMLFILLVLVLCLAACSPQEKPPESVGSEPDMKESSEEESTGKVSLELPEVIPGETAGMTSKYTDENGDTAIIPKDFRVSELEGEYTVNTGAVVIGPDGSEFVWVPTDQTEFAVYDFGSYFGGGSITGYWDETEQELYQDMVKSVGKYGGFYMGRFEASCGGYNLMGGECSGADYPAALRDPLPGNNHHPNVTFRAALFVK